MTDRVRALPLRPDLDQRKKQAKELKRREGGTLTQAQRRLAQAHGFPSWPRLRAAVLSLAVPLPGDEVRIEAGPFGGRHGRIASLEAGRREVRVTVRLPAREVDVWLDERHLTRSGSA